MPISTTSLVSQINTALASSTTVLQRGQLAAAAAALGDSVVSVNTINDLPAAADSTGRLIYVNSICDYRYSDGSVWTREYNSNLAYSNQVWTWGYNSDGRLGDNTAVNKSSPVSIVGGFTDWCQISGGNSHTTAVRTNGTLWSWGSSACGQLGDGTVVNKSSPVQVVGGFTDWCQVAGGRERSAAVRINGTLWTWGRGTEGQLGDNTVVNKSSPVQVVGGFTDWCQVSAFAGIHTAAVRTNGTLWTWGHNGQGYLGDNTTVAKSSPVSVVGGFTDWCQVAVGSQHTAAIRISGTLWTWGSNGFGMLGANLSVNCRISPGQIAGGLTNWCQVSAGQGFAAAVRTNGTIWAWGYNGDGRLGDGTIISKSSPVQVVGGFTDWCQVAAGFNNSAAIRTDGSLWTWGRDANGQLGDNAVVNKSSPVSVVGGFTNWCQVAAGSAMTAAIRSDPVRGF